MNFGSLNFIFVFLPLFVLLHGVTKGMVRNTVLFLGSLLFYGLAIGKFYEWLILILISALINYLVALVISDTEGKYRKAVFVVGIVFNVLYLCTYKFADSYISTLSLPFISALNKVGILSPTVALPLGISFYTFKNISYLNEVYSNKVASEPSFINYGAYITMFPQISMGPIQTYSDFKPYLNSRIVNLEKIGFGLSEFIIGFGLKKIFADRLSGIWNEIETVGYESISTPFAWLGIISFSLQLYFDFYGYSLMSSGIGEMLGYSTPKNFDYPYISRSMGEFWRRWHMTLGVWFKENVYFPLGGSRCSKPKLLRNLFIVWLLTGIWHGSTLNFVAWGLFLFVLIALEKLGPLKFVTENKYLSHIYMFFAILLSWALFKLPTLSDFALYLSRMFPFFSEVPAEVYVWDWLKYVEKIGWLIVVAIFFCTPLPRRIFEKYRSKTYITVPLLLIIFWYSVYLAACGANDPFLYFNF